MLRISKLTDYALLIMGQMAKTPHAVLSASQLAQDIQLSVPTVSKILKMLCEKQLVASVRGSIGGYHLARSPDTITVADVIGVMEGKVAMTECSKKINHCGIQTHCTMRENWRNINRRIENLLASFTLMDMLQPISITRPIDVE